MYNKAWARETALGVPPCNSELAANQHIWPYVYHDELDIRAECMEDGDTYPPWWMDQELGKIGQTRIVSTSEFKQDVRGL